MSMPGIEPTTSSCYNLPLVPQGISKRNSASRSLHLSTRFHVRIPFHTVCLQQIRVTTMRYGNERRLQMNLGKGIETWLSNLRVGVQISNKLVYSSDSLYTRFFRLCSFQNLGQRSLFLRGVSRCAVTGGRG